MTIRVPHHELADTLALYGPGIIIPTPADGDFARVHEVVVRVVDGGRAVEVPGSLARSVINRLPADDRVTISFQPRDPHGWVLLIDGHASTTHGSWEESRWPFTGGFAVVDAQDTMVRVEVASAMLHRARGL